MPLSVPVVDAAADDDDFTVLSVVDGMKAHNRRLALTWPIGSNGAAPAMKVSIQPAYMQQIHVYLKKHWPVGAHAMQLVDAEAKVKAKLSGFKSYGNTVQNFNPDLQIESTLLISPDLVSKCQLYVPSFGNVMMAVVEHARHWSALRDRTHWFCLRPRLRRAAHYTSCVVVTKTPALGARTHTTCFSRNAEWLLHGMNVLSCAAGILCASERT